MTMIASENQPVPTVDPHRVALIHGLRECADFLEQHPIVQVPYSVSLNSFVGTKDELVAQARVTSWEKVYQDQYFFLKKSFGPAVSLEINADRELLCKRVVVGTRKEPAKTVEVVEWKCEDEALLAHQG